MDSPILKRKFEEINENCCSTFSSPKISLEPPSIIRRTKKCKKLIEARSLIEEIRHVLHLKILHNVQENWDMQFD